MGVWALSLFVVGAIALVAFNARRHPVSLVVAAVASEVGASGDTARFEIVGLDCDEPLGFDGSDPRSADPSNEPWAIVGADGSGTTVVRVVVSEPSSVGVESPAAARSSEASTVVADRTTDDGRCLHIEIKPTVGDASLVAEELLAKVRFTQHGLNDTAQVEWPNGIHELLRGPAHLSGSSRAYLYKERLVLLTWFRPTPLAGLDGDPHSFSSGGWFGYSPDYEIGGETVSGRVAVFDLLRTTPITTQLAPIAGWLVSVSVYGGTDTIAKELADRVQIEPPNAACRRDRIMERDTAQQPTDRPFRIASRFGGEVMTAFVRLEDGCWTFASGSDFSYSYNYSDCGEPIAAIGLGSMRSEAGAVKQTYGIILLRPDVATVRILDSDSGEELIPVSDTRDGTDVRVAGIFRFPLAGHTAVVIEAHNRSGTLLQRSGLVSDEFGETDAARTLLASPPIARETHDELAETVRLTNVQLRRADLDGLANRPELVSVDDVKRIPAVCAQNNLVLSNDVGGQEEIHVCVAEADLRPNTLQVNSELLDRIGPSQHTLAIVGNDVVSVRVRTANEASVHPVIRPIERSNGPAVASFPAPYDVSAETTYEALNTEGNVVATFTFPK